MQVKSIEIKPVLKKDNRTIEIWIIQISIDNFGKEYKKRRLFDSCYKHQTKRLKELLKQADNLYGFNNKTLEDTYGLTLHGLKTFFTFFAFFLILHLHYADRHVIL